METVNTLFEYISPTVALTGFCALIVLVIVYYSYDTFVTKKKVRQDSKKKDDDEDSSTEEEIDALIESIDGKQKKMKK